MDKSMIIMFVIVTAIVVGVTYDAVSKGMWYVPVIVGIGITLSMFVLLGTDWFSEKPKQQNNSVNDRRTD